jgi:hypothetical protein
MFPMTNQFGKVAGAVGGYFGNIGKNIRDVGTAAGTNIQIARSGDSKSIQNKPLDVAGSKNFGTQIKEVGGAFLGKPGTRSDQYSKSTGYVPGKKLM